MTRRKRPQPSEVVDKPIGELRVWEDNPRSITTTRFKQLVRSMKEDPEMMSARPLIALPDGRVIAGNMRLRGALELGWPTVKTVTIALDEARALTWALRDNNPYGEWDDQAVAEMLYNISQSAPDTIDLAGFTPAEVDKMLASVSGVDERGDRLALADVSIGEPSRLPARGSVWAAGDHLVCVMDVYEGWPEWSPLLTEGCLFVPYPTPTLPMTYRAQYHRLIMVQPDPFLAGHLLDKYAAVYGDDTVFATIPA